MVEYPLEVAQEIGRKLREKDAEIERLRATLLEVRQAIWLDSDGGPRYAGYLAIIDAALPNEALSEAKG